MKHALLAFAFTAGIMGRFKFHVDIEAAIGRRWNPDPAALRAYRIHIGLGSIGYCATRDRWDDVALNAEWLLALA